MSENLPFEQAILNLEVQTRDPRLIPALFGPDPKVGTRAEVFEKAVFEYTGSLKRRGALPGLPETIHFTLTFASGVAAKVVASWLYEKLKGRAVELRIDRKVTEVSAEGIHRVISESLSLKR
jgi:hypothetical protein